MNNENQEPNPEDLRASWEFAHVSPLNDGRDYFHHDGELWGVPRNADGTTPHFSEAENPEFWEVGLETHEMESIKRALEIAEKVARAAMTDAPKRFKNRADHEAFCTRVIALLTESKILSCTYEHPGYINVPLPNEHSLACGDMNGFWSVDFNDQDGSQLECGGSFSHTANPGASERDVAELIGRAALHYLLDAARFDMPERFARIDQEADRYIAHLPAVERKAQWHVLDMAARQGFRIENTGGGCMSLFRHGLGVQKKHYAQITASDDPEVPADFTDPCCLGIYADEPAGDVDEQLVALFECESLAQALMIAERFKQTQFQL